MPVLGITTTNLPGSPNIESILLGNSPVVHNNSNIEISLEVELLTNVWIYFLFFRSELKYNLFCASTSINYLVSELKRLTFLGYKTQSSSVIRVNFVTNNKQLNNQKLFIVWPYGDMPRMSIYIEKVQRMQNKTACVVSEVHDWSLNGIEIVNQLRWQTVRERRNYLSAFKYTNV